ncbi:HotDog domain-containing protein [Flammula alnicola]|nr:HotDog domain-containing protein [Flammula alnicola]
MISHRDTRHARLFSTSPPPHPRHGRPLVTFAAVAVAAVVAGTLGAIYPPPPISILFPRAHLRHRQPDSPESQAITRSLEEQLQDLPYLKQLRERDDAKAWYETRPYQNFPEERRVNNLTAGALRGPGRLALFPLIRAKYDESESIIFLHLGRGLCGHDGIIHGGLLATLLMKLLQERLSTTPEKVGVTAQLTLNYRAPTMADQFVVIKTHVNELKGRKVTVSGTVEDLTGTVLVEASGTFVQPRYAKLLHSAQLRKAMGEPPSPPEHEEPILLADGQDLNPGHKHR